MIANVRKGSLNLDWNAQWIGWDRQQDVVPCFWKVFTLPQKQISSAVLQITAKGVYEASLNASRVGEFIFAPGWTVYEKRLQYQCYDVSSQLKQGENRLEVLVGKGWWKSPLPGWANEEQKKMYHQRNTALLAQLNIVYEDGETTVICTDGSWQVQESAVRFSEIYDGEIYDAAYIADASDAVTILNESFEQLIPQQGSEVRMQERLSPVGIFTAPNGERILDFGQEITGYVEVSVTAQKGQRVSLSFGEVLDKDGNFYNANYRGAKSQYEYFCCNGKQSYHPFFTFYGFRYVRINAFPGGVEQAQADHFTGIVLHSQMERTGSITSSNPLLNQLCENIVWGQKGNFLDVPTDCPQRDERLGWTGDAQAFVRTACFNYDCERFFAKWMADLAADQGEDGYVPHVVPDVIHAPKASAAWGDAATICPWEVYLAYGNKEILQNQYESMTKWVDYITNTTTTQFLWTGGEHYGDWLGLDAPSGSYKGSTREDFIASAFYAHSVSLVIKAGRVLGKDVSMYETLYDKIQDAFRKTYPTFTTQTECVLAAQFCLTDHVQAAADQLAQMVQECGVQLQTGFVGTPYLLHVLSRYGYTKLAYSLLLRQEYPSWLYPVTKGATTVWEHWDGIMPNGEFWSTDMNSFNHYAYGAVADWIYGVAVGINPVEDAAGYERVRIAPMPNESLDWLDVSLKTRKGTIRSAWNKQGESFRYTIHTPVDAEIVIAGKKHLVAAGSYIYYSPINT